MREDYGAKTKEDKHLRFLDNTCGAEKNNAR